MGNYAGWNRMVVGEEIRNPKSEIRMKSEIRNPNRGHRPLVIC